MYKLLTSVALAALLTATPAIAADKAGADAADTGASSDLSEMLNQEGQNREPGEDGTFQGKPVVEGPADFSHLKPTGSDSSTGASSGEAGESLDDKAGSGAE